MRSPSRNSVSDSQPCVKGIIPVKVLCFDTLLQVFILKVVRVAVSALLQPFAKWAPFEAPQGASEGRECAGKRRPGGVHRRERSFEIWTGATMRKGSAEVYWK